jgi:selenide,water dikinase
LRDLPFISDPNLIVGMEHAEDAGVYKLRDDLAIVQTIDFFTPIVDDPFIFGQIAVTNALSDVYAMGGKPLTAMNVVCFPIGKMDIAILRDILRGGLDKMREAGVLLVGGHSVDDAELKYGLAVTGVIHPDKVLLNRGVKEGDKLILTKALGTGIVSTALKRGLADDALADKSVRSMTQLNKKAAELMVAAGNVHAVTDITGFGFLGHACEMIEASGLEMVIYATKVPFFPGIQKLAENGIVPGGLHRNREFRLPMIDVAASCPPWLLDILFDPQTAGGLLLSLPSDDAERLLVRMHHEGITEAAIVGEVVASTGGGIRVLA